MKTINPDYLFKWEPEKKTLFFITQSAHASGIAMKNLQEVQPQVVERVQSLCKDKPSIGNIITFDNYIFIVSRKHYSSKHDLDLVSNALDQVKDLSIKVSGEDFPTILGLVKSYSNIEIRNISNWEHSIL